MVSARSATALVGFLVSLGASILIWVVFEHCPRDGHRLETESSRHCP
ncbi:MAG: hypothetical protein ACI8XM_000365 [Haloarculaceae archaeon]|jgi:hypothetical protein